MVWASRALIPHSLMTLANRQPLHILQGLFDITILQVKDCFWMRNPFPSTSVTVMPSERHYIYFQMWFAIACCIVRSRIQYVHKLSRLGILIVRSGEFCVNNLIVSYNWKQIGAKVTPTLVQTSGFYLISTWICIGGPIVLPRDC